jgi:hypothetical protein
LYRRAEKCEYHLPQMNSEKVFFGCGQSTFFRSSGAIAGVAKFPLDQIVVKPYSEFINLKLRVFFIQGVTELKMLFSELHRINLVALLVRNLVQEQNC